MIGFIEISLLSFSFLCIMMNKVIYHNPRAIFNIYQQPDGFYWFKLILIFCFLYLRQLFHKIKYALMNNTELEQYYEKLEMPHKLSNHEQPIDAVYFNAANVDGDHLVVGTARRKHGLIDGFLYLKINNENIGLLQSPKLPDTSLYQEEEKEEYDAEGLKICCLEPMKKWKISYHGKMTKYLIPEKNLDVDLEVIYTSNQPFFNFDTDISPFMMAKCIALEKWSPEYFRLLKMHHQTHYEQHGFLKGSALINGKTFPINMDSMRDHSFGNHREWKNLHKYNIQVFAAENGDRFTVTDVCFPLTLSNFQTGFVYLASDDKVYPITRNDFKLYQHGESGTPPTDYAFTIRAGGKNFTVKVDVVDSPHFFISRDWECKVFERFCKFRINGLRGWGASEWQQRNISGRNILKNQYIEQSSHEQSKTTKQFPVRKLVGTQSTQLFEKMLKS